MSTASGTRGSRGFRDVTNAPAVPQGAAKQGSACGSRLVPAIYLPKFALGISDARALLQLLPVGRRRALEKDMGDATKPVLSVGEARDLLMGLVNSSSSEVAPAVVAAPVAADHQEDQHAASVTAGSTT